MTIENGCGVQPFALEQVAIEEIDPPGEDVRVVGLDQFSALPWLAAKRSATSCAEKR